MISLSPVLSRPNSVTIFLLLLIPFSRFAVMLLLYISIEMCSLSCRPVKILFAPYTV